jgi:hypothetical protein
VLIQEAPSYLADVYAAYIEPQIMAIPFLWVE